VVDPEAVDEVLVHEPEDELVGLLEDVRQLHPQARQGVHLEEAAVVDVARRHPPIGRAIGLPFQEAVQGVEALGLAGGAVEHGHGPVDGLAERRSGRHRRGEAALERLGSVRGGARVPLFQAPQGLGERDGLAGRAPLAQGRQGKVEHHRIGGRADREAVLPMPDAEAPLVRVEGELELALLQGLPVGAAEEGHDEPAVGAGALPVDVEGIRMGRQPPPFEHGEPPGVVLAAHAHVVGHDVEQELEPMGLQGLREAAEALLAPEFRIDGGVIDDVVAVHGAGGGRLDRRGIGVADAEARQIGRDPRRIVEGEVLVELEPVGGAGRRRRQGPPRGAGVPPFLGHGHRELRQEASRGGDLLDGVGKPPPPVGMAGIHAGHVGLVQLARGVLDLDSRENGGGSRQIAHRALDRRLLRQGRGGE
jgi:hypothetical protein